MTDKDLKRDYKAAPIAGSSTDIQALIAKHRVHLTDPLGADPKEAAASGWEKDTTVDDRKALLKAQLLQLQGRGL